MKKNVNYEVDYYKIDYLNYEEWSKIIGNYRENIFLQFIEIECDSIDKELLDWDYRLYNEDEEYVTFTRLHENYNLVIYMKIKKQKEMV